MQNVVGYVRVSSLRQVEDGLGLEIQEEAIRKWCDEHQRRLVGMWRDEGVSGTIADRPGLGAAVAAVEDGAAAELVVYRMDRLARDLILQETIIERLATSDRRVVSVTEPDLAGTDPTRVLIRQLLGAISQYERMVISARMQSGRRAKSARGGFAYGSPPLGWRSVNRELVPDDREQATVARILELHDEGKSLRTIAAILTEEGHHPKRAAKWHSDVIRRVIARAERGSLAEVIPLEPRRADTA